MDVKAPLLEVKDLQIHFPSRRGLVRAVNGVSWSVNKGETLVILGESGSGKSVSASAVLDLIDAPPAQIAGGEILFRGRDLLKIARKERMTINGNKISMIFQDPLAALNPVYTVGRQIAETMTIHGQDRETAKRRAVDLLARVGIDEPERRARQFPHQFSGGQRQRIMIAAAIALEPDLLIADEPTSALDVTIQAQVLALLKDIQRESGMAIVMITHDLAVVKHVADKVVVMNDGKVVETGSATQIIDAPRHPYTQKLVAAMPGKGPFSRSPASSGSAPILEIRDVYRHYGGPEGVRAVDGINLAIARGETLGVVGESGSGKSTLARLILGLDAPTSGEIRFDGENLMGRSGAELRRVRRRMQFVFQDPTASLNPRMRVGEIVSEPWAIHADVLPRTRWRERVRELLELVGLHPDFIDRYPHQFSGGQRQRIAIARALALKPEVIVCDEAVSALDVSVQDQVIELLKSLRDELGLTYVFIAHDLLLVRDFATRVAVFHKGRIVEENLTEPLYSEPRHPYTRQLLAASGIDVGAEVG